MSSTSYVSACAQRSCLNPEVARVLTRFCVAGAVASIALAVIFMGNIVAANPSATYFNKWSLSQQLYLAGMAGSLGIFMSGFCLLQLIPKIKSQTTN